jgi:hypothetical protein
LYVGGLVGGNWAPVPPPPLPIPMKLSNSRAAEVSLGEPTATFQTNNSVSIMGGYASFGTPDSHSATITNCYATGNVSGDLSVGGLVGQNGWCYSWGGCYPGTISYCYSTASVSGDERVGGLVGRNTRGTITNCYSTVSVTGTNDVGGLVGENYRASIANCYSTASVLGNYAVGGLVGRHWRGTVSDSFWDIEASGQTTSAGGMGKTTAEMQTASTFVGWGCEPVWTIDAGKDYPRLWWENIPGELILTPSYGGGSGEPNDPYLIYTAEQLNAIGLFPCEWDKCFKLMADIDLFEYTGTSFNIIGTSTYYPTYGTAFTGVFDGNGHTISNFSYTSTERDNVGLFGYVDDPNAAIIYLGLIDPDVYVGTHFVGSLVGRLREGTINNCYIEGASITGDYVTGGLVGNNFQGTITNCYATGSVSGSSHVGGLVGDNLVGTISNSYAAGSIAGDYFIGGLVGSNYDGIISNCYSTGSVTGDDYVGGLVGTSGEGTITNCYSTGTILGDGTVGGLVGLNFITITNCYSTGIVTGDDDVGGLVGANYGTISNCHSEGVVSGVERIGGLVGQNGWCRSWGGCNPGTISNCYSTGSVSGRSFVGGLVGENEYGYITNCYSTGSVTGTSDVGGLVGHNDEQYGVVTASFWDIDTSGQTTSAGGTGLTTAEMQLMSTFTDAGWDFTTPVWTIDEGVDYPRLWWELLLLLHAEPEVTLGTSNTISWDPVPGANDYYAECAADANFTNILYNTGWITETSYKFAGLELGKRYWYSVKARNVAGTETNWSNVESSLQVTLADVVETLLNPVSLKNKNMKNALLNKVNEVQQMIDEGLYEAALNKLRNDVLQKTDGCAETGQPDKNDWIITCQEQGKIYPLVIETIEYVRSLME